MQDNIQTFVKHNYTFAITFILITSHGEKHYIKYTRKLAANLFPVHVFSSVLIFTCAVYNYMLQRAGGITKQRKDF